MSSPWNDEAITPVIDLLSRRWVPAILAALWPGPLRRVELRHQLPGISDKSLTETLRELQHRGHLTRTHYNEIPPHVEYQLTPTGHTLGTLLITLSDWITTHNELQQ